MMLISLFGRLYRMICSSVLYLLFLLMVAALLYSFLEWRQNTPPSALTDAPVRPLQTLQGVLFQNGEAWELYQMINGKSTVVATKKFPHAVLSSPRWLSANALFVSAASGASIIDMRTGKLSPLAHAPWSNFASMGRISNTVFSTMMLDSRYVLAIQYSECVDPLTVSLPEPSSDDTVAMLTARSLPIQRTMVFSQYENRLALLDHTVAPHIALVNVAEKSSQELIVPDFGPEQVHFSPLFIGSDAVLFSVLQGKRTATVLYHISDARYETVSEHFTDRAMFSFSGDIVLLQSFYDDGATNVPFGSLSLYRSAHAVPSALLDAILGTGEEARSLRQFFFTEPEASTLHFRDTLTRSDFLRVPSDTRARFLELWDGHPAGHPPTGTFVILKGAPSSFATVGTVEFWPEEERGYATYDQNVTLLLSALDLPSALQDEYAKRSARDGYRLVEPLW